MRGLLPSAIVSLRRVVTALCVDSRFPGSSEWQLLASFGGMGCNIEAPITRNIPEGFYKNSVGAYS